MRDLLQGTDTGLSYSNQVTMGRLPNFFNVFATAGKIFPNVSTSFTMVWQSPTIEPCHQSAHPARIVSTSNQDSPGGTGWRSVKVWGLDNNFDLVTDQFPTGGVAGSTGTIPFRRVFRVQAGSLGSANQAVGSLTLTQTVTGELFAREVVNVNELRKCYYPIPRGYYGFVRSLDVVILGTAIYDYRLVARSPSNVVTILDTIGHQGRTEVQYSPPYVIPPTYEVFPLLRYDSALSGGGGSMELILVPEQYVVNNNIYSPKSLL